MASTSGNAFNAYFCYGPTFPNERLYRIAMAFRPNFCVSVQQVMVAILKANPAAFNRENVNGLKAGYRLRIPPLLLIRQINPIRAEQIISEQNDLWNNKVFAQTSKVSVPTLQTSLKSTKVYRKSSSKKLTASLVTVHKKTTKTRLAKNEDIEEKVIVPKKKAVRAKKTLVPTTTVTPPRSTVIDIAQEGDTTTETKAATIPSLALQTTETKTKTVTTKPASKTTVAKNHITPAAVTKTTETKVKTTSSTTTKTTATNIKTAPSSTATDVVPSLDQAAAAPTPPPAQPLESTTVKTPQTTVQDKLQPSTATTAAVTTLAQEVQTYKQQTDARLDNLEKQTKDLETKINQLDDEFKTMTYHYIQSAPKTGSRIDHHYVEQLKQNVRNRADKLLLGLLLLLSFLAVLFVSRRAKRRAARRDSLMGSKGAAKTEKEKDEYDFLGGNDSIPTKLDLARAYIDMGDHKAAKSALNEVMAKGNAEQKKEAQDLLSKIQS